MSSYVRRYNFSYFLNRDTTIVAVVCRVRHFLLEVGSHRRRGPHHHIT